MEISSPGFEDGARIPGQYVMPGACGRIISVPLIWEGAPSGTKSFAIAMVDPLPVAQNWVHWLVINIPATTTSIPEGASKGKLSGGTIELNNSFGDIGYGGPQPPKGTGNLPYVITVYALKVEKLDLGVKTSLERFKKAIDGKLIGSATVTGKFGR